LPHEPKTYSFALLPQAPIEQIVPAKIGLVEKNMNRDKARLQDGRVFDIRDLNVEQRYLHPDYTYVKGDGKLSETGQLILFELKPNKESDPSFIARWDGGNRAIPEKIQYAVDIDMRGPSKAAEKKFRDGADGYCGHHTEKVSDTENKYRALIKTPNGRVFDATICFTKHHGLTIQTQTRV
jgi:hypothetical protein